MLKHIHCTITLIFFLFVFFNLNSTLAYAYPEGWSDDMLISPDSVRRAHPDVSTDSHNNVWVVWDSTGWGSGIIYYTKLDSLGNVLIPETQVSISGYSQRCRIAVDLSDNVHILWREWAGSSPGCGLGYVKLDSSGSVIIPPRLVASGAGSVNRPFFHITFNQERKEVHVLMEEIIDGYEQMSYILLDSLGDTLCSRVTVPNPNTNAYWGGIGIDLAGNNHIAYRSDSSYQSERLVYTKLDRQGNRLVPNTVLSDEGCDPSIVCDEHQNVHIYFIDGIGQDTMYYMKLDNDGNVLIPPTGISLLTDSSNYTCHAIIDVEQSLHVVWMVSRSQQVAWIMYVKMDTAGNFITSPEEIVCPPYTFWILYPRITCDSSNRLHLVWADGRVDTVLSIYYKRGENEQAVEEWNTNVLPDQYPLSVSPNPFCDATYIRIGCPDGSAFSSSAANNAESLTLRIYNITGRLVRRFSLPTAYTLLPTVVTWYGDDDHRQQLPAGVYYIVYEDTHNLVMEKVVMLR